jgi:hypothetical protein
MATDVLDSVAAVEQLRTDRYRKLISKALAGKAIDPNELDSVLMAMGVSPHKFADGINAIRNYRAHREKANTRAEHDAAAAAAQAEGAAARKQLESAVEAAEQQFRATMAVVQQKIADAHERLSEVRDAENALRQTSIRDYDAVLQEVFADIIDEDPEWARQNRDFHATRQRYHGDTDGWQQVQ